MRHYYHKNLIFRTGWNLIFPQFMPSKKREKILLPFNPKFVIINRDSLTIFFIFLLLVDVPIQEKAHSVVHSSNFILNYNWLKKIVSWGKLSERVRLFSSLTDGIRSLLKPATRPFIRIRKGPFYGSFGPPN